MRANNCRPDVVTYTALVTAYERGGQWIKALQAFQQMQQQAGCSADAILYATLLDVLWDTGIPWAQHQAAQLFRVAVEDGHCKQLPLPPTQQQPAASAAAAGGSEGGSGKQGEGTSSTPGSPSALAAPAHASSSGVGGAATAGSSKLELGMQGVSPGVAMLMLHCWLADLQQLVEQQGQQQGQAATPLPERVLISAGRNRQRDHISGLLRDSTLALLASWGSPFALASSGGSSSSSSAAQASAVSANDGNTSSGSSTSNLAAAAAVPAAGTGGAGSPNSNKLEAQGVRVATWLQEPRMAQVLQGFVRPACLPTGHQRRQGGGRAAAASVLADLSDQLALEQRCQDAFAAVKRFESTHCLSVQAMGAAYTSARPECVRQLLQAGQQLRLPRDVVHDAVLLMDRAMSASFKVRGVRCAGMSDARACSTLFMARPAAPWLRVHAVHGRG
jgi:pentatricopeptide repeat domain-containing protein 1